MRLPGRPVDLHLSANAINSGKTLWTSENGSQDYNDGAKPLARGINRGYLDGQDDRATSTGT